MLVEVWSDIACPWCWLGKHHLEAALRQAGLDEATTVEMRSFELDPTPRPTRGAREHLVAKFGSAERLDAAHARLVAMGEQAGIRYDFAAASVANTFDAHRVHHYAKTQGRGAEVVERFMRAYHGEGAPLADHDTLARLAEAAGLDGARVREVLADPAAFARDVREDEARAVGLGIHGVPFFLVDGKYGISGAQPVDAFLAAFRQIEELEKGEASSPARA